MSGPKKLLSIIVPTYNEKGNMQKLFAGLTAALEQHGIPHEIIVMDDVSPDKTGEEVARLSKSGGFHRARCVVRQGKKRGLSPAVIDGFQEAKGDVILVMDADLSHPVDVVPLLYRRVAEGGADIAVGSRHVSGGGIEHWPLHRRIISFGAAAMARPLTNCSDPMSGFFALKPEVIKNAKINADGFKILLEILVKGNYKTLQEEPIVFKDREVGESKLTSGVMKNYIIHLMHLYLHPGSAPFFKFLAVGFIGMIIDVALFSILCSLLHINPVISQIFSFFAALCNNYFLNSKWTFPNKQKQTDTQAQFIRFAIVSLIAFGLRTILYSSICNLFGITKAPGLQIVLVLVIVIVTAVNFLGSKLWAFKTK